MRHYYSRTFLGLGIVFVALVAAAMLANSAASSAKAREAALLRDDAAGKRRRAGEMAALATLQTAMDPVRKFAAAWRESARLSEKDSAERIRSDIEAMAQRQLGLVTDNAITPQPDRYLFQANAIRVQRVTLRASGKDLVALMTWLGKVEEKYPGALVELCDFSSNVGGNTGLTIRLVQPLLESASHGTTVPAMSAVALSAEPIAAQNWLQYLPAKVKGTLPVGFARNPLQPAIAAEAHALPSLRDGGDEITPRLETVLDGHLRSVIRGATPIVVVDGRVFRVGDELVVGAGRERPIPDAKTKLKLIGEDRLVFHVAGGSADHPVQCDVAYALPAFLKAR